REARPQLRQRRCDVPLVVAHDGSHDESTHKGEEKSMSIQSKFQRRAALQLGWFVMACGGAQTPVSAPPSPESTAPPSAAPVASAPAAPAPPPGPKAITQAPY